MADLLPLLQLSFSHVLAGTLPPTEIVKALISKVGWWAAAAL
jgi:hypothetical protein